MTNSEPFMDVGDSFNDVLDELDSEFTVTPQDTYALPATAYPPYEGQISDSSLYDDIPMNLDGSGHRSSESSHSLVSKRRQNTLDFDSLSPLSILEPSSAMTPPQSKRARLDPSANSDLPLAELDRDPSQHSGRIGAETSALPEPRLDLERDDLVPDIGSSLELILNQLAEEESQRQESEQERYVTSLFGAASDSSAESTFPNPATDFAIPSDVDPSGDELLQNLFDGLQTLSLGDESFSSQPEPDADGGILGEDSPSHPWRSPRPADASPHFPLPGGPLTFLYQENNDDVESSVAGPSLSGTTLPNKFEESASFRVETPTLQADVIWSGELDEEMSRHGNLFDSGFDDPDHDAGSLPEAGISHCPCNQCSPRPPTHPDPFPSRHSQQEIHRLFLLSPFAHPTNSMR